MKKLRKVSALLSACTIYRVEGGTKKVSGVVRPVVRPGQILPLVSGVFGSCSGRLENKCSYRRTQCPDTFRTDTQLDLGGHLPLPSLEGKGVRPSGVKEESGEA